jgi:nitrite reductase/ring-hydroxylating ferredoxin subunit
MTAPSSDVLTDACSVDELRQAGKRVVSVEGEDVFLVWNDGEPSALRNTCIHKQRSLSDGSLFNGRAVCPGHQWSFDLRTGFCKERDRYQPVHQVHVVGDRVLIDPVAVAGPADG